MNDRSLDQLLNAWLDLGPEAAPERVGAAARLEVRSTRQLAAWIGWLQRFPIMNSTTIRYGVAAVVVVIAALLGVSYLSPNVGAPGTTAMPTPEPTAIPTPTPLGTRDPLEPGSYAVPGFSAGVTVAVPSGGWSSNDGWVVIGPRGNEEPDGMAIRFYSASNLFENPASPADGYVEVGPSGADLVQAILDHPVLEATGPTDVTIDGHEGQMVELTIPADAEMTSEGQYLLFAEPTGGQVWGWAPGQTFDLYIVEVDGERLSLDAFHFADTPEDDLAAQRAVVDSIQFDS